MEQVKQVSTVSLCMQKSSNYAPLAQLGERYPYKVDVGSSSLSRSTILIEVKDMELRFVGKDGSMGLRNGRVYKTKIWSDKRYIWVTAKIGISKTCHARMKQQLHLPRTGSWYDKLLLCSISSVG